MVNNYLTSYECYEHTIDVIFKLAIFVYNILSMEIKRMLNIFHTKIHRAFIYAHASRFLYVWLHLYMFTFIHVKMPINMLPRVYVRYIISLSL